MWRIQCCTTGRGSSSVPNHFGKYERSNNRAIERGCVLAQDSQPISIESQYSYRENLHLSCSYTLNLQSLVNAPSWASLTFSYMYPIF